MLLWWEQCNDCHTVMTQQVLGVITILMENYFGNGWKHIVHNYNSGRGPRHYKQINTHTNV